MPDAVKSRRPISQEGNCDALQELLDQLHEVSDIDERVYILYEVNKMIFEAISAAEEAQVEVMDDVAIQKIAVAIIYNNTLEEVLTRFPDQLYQLPYVQQVEDIARLLIHFECEVTDHIEVIWNSQIDKEEAIGENIYILMQSLALDLSATHIEWLSEHLVDSWPPTNIQHQNRILQLFLTVSRNDLDGLTIHKLLSALWNLSHRKDILPQIMDDIFEILVKILKYYYDDDIESPKFSWLIKCVKEFQDDTLWEVPSMILMKKLFCSYKPYTKLMHQKERRFCRESTIDYLQSKYNLIAMIVQSLTVYINKIKSCLVDDPKFIIDGHYTHNQQVEERLEFLSFLLKEGRQAISLNQSVEIWKSLIENPVSRSDHTLCLEWFEKLLSQGQDLDPVSVNIIFVNKILTLPTTNMCEIGFRCFKAFFLATNTMQKRLEHKKDHLIVRDPELVGLDYIWNIILSANDKIAAAATDLLRQVSIHIKLKMPTSQIKYHDLHIKKFFTLLKSNYDTPVDIDMKKLTTVRRVSKVLCDYVEGFERTCRKGRQNLPLKIATRGNDMLLITQFTKPMRNVPDFDFFTHENDIFLSLRKCIWRKVRSYCSMELTYEDTLLKPEYHSFICNLHELGRQRCDRLRDTSRQLLYLLSCQPKTVEAINAVFNDVGSHKADFQHMFFDGNPTEGCDKNTMCSIFMEILKICKLILLTVCGIVGKPSFGGAVICSKELPASRKLVQEALTTILAKGSDVTMLKVTRLLSKQLLILMKNDHNIAYGVLFKNAQAWQLPSNAGVIQITRLIWATSSGNIQAFYGSNEVLHSLCASNNTLETEEISLYQRALELLSIAVVTNPNGLQLFCYDKVFPLFLSDLLLLNPNHMLRMAAAEQILIIFVCAEQNRKVFQRIRALLFALIKDQTIDKHASMTHELFYLLCQIISYDKAWNHADTLLNEETGWLRNTSSPHPVLLEGHLRLTTALLDCVKSTRKQEVGDTYGGNLIKILLENVLFPASKIMNYLRTTKRKIKDTVSVSVCDTPNSRAAAFNLLNALCENWKQIRITEQQDAVHFYLLLVGCLKEALAKLEGPRVLHALEGTFSDQIICKECPHQYLREESFSIISVNIKNHKNLQSSLEEYVKAEILEGDNAYFCDQCQKKVATIKRLCIKDLPKTMVIQLKRFEYDRRLGCTVKFNDHFEFPRDIDMLPYTIVGLNKNGEDVVSYNTDKDNYHTKYKLSGIVIHSGEASGKA
ncbi:hypothetical protein ILUMI_22368 [Ignelater luminosus]|uniref:ubiquitinyl hydrolase 1 n=1 Tax=Ignelater luminosus TaxID=2038154 RepID=A0A8K0G0K9_IGNLU|nr:hypothetical protein ILUMI_22368 [Ignelater luminosus]